MTDNRWFRTNSVTYPLNALAKTISGEFYISGGISAEGVLKICNSGGKVIYESPIMRESTDPVKFSVDVEKEISVKIVFEDIGAGINGHSDLYLKNPTITSSDY